jgi:L-alanine-DL-glutamate epimerase-like enolase superfamily enzyme
VNACLERSLFLEYNVCDNPMLQGIIQNPIQLDREGMMSVPDESGVGIRIDEKAVAHFTVGKL